MLRTTCLVLFATSASAAAECPAVVDRSSELAFLFTRANAARSEIEARPIAGAMWSIWADAPDDRSQTLLDLSRDRMAARDLAGAKAALDDLVAYCPDYAEGYNQRAFVAYQQRDFGPALEDLDRALERQPLHVAAMSGKALTLIGLGRNGEAQTWLRRALRLNPWLSERALLRPRGDTF